MIRVVYRWHVEPKKLASFTKAWSEAANHIHETVPGALGSLMLQACTTGSEVLTVAKWQSLESWKKFWGINNPKQMEAMREFGQRISVEVFNEIGDFTR